MSDWQDPILSMCVKNVKFFTNVYGKFCKLPTAQDCSHSYREHTTNCDKIHCYCIAGEFEVEVIFNDYYKLCNILWKPRV